MSASLLSDEELMSAYVAGQTEAFTRLFDRYAPRLLGWSKRSGLTTEAAEDVVQQTFLLLHRSQRDYRSGEKLRPWVYAIALNVRRKYWRRCRRKPVQQLFDEPAGATPQAGLRIDINRAIGALPDGQQEVMWLRHEAQLTFTEVASVLGISVEAAKVRAHRARCQLRKFLSAPSAGELS